MSIKFQRMPWEALKSDITADDTSLITTFEHSNATYKAGSWPIPPEISSIVIAFWGKDGINKACDYKLFGRGRLNGPIEEVAAGNIILGSRLVTVDPISQVVETAYWVDSITNTIEWVKNPVVKNTENNGIAYLNIDTKRLMDVYLEITNVGGDNEMTEINAIITGMANA